MSNLMKIRAEGTELFQADGRKDRPNAANSSFLLFCLYLPVTYKVYTRTTQHTHFFTATRQVDLMICNKDMAPCPEMQ
jgi:hypothetical protein